MHGYNTIGAQIYYLRHIYMAEPRVHYKVIASATGDNYCPDYYSSYI